MGQYVERFIIGKYSEAQAKAAAILSYHVGVSCNMDYSVEGSGATAKDIATGLKNYFSYDNNLEYIERTHFNESDWSDFLKAELNEKRPILYFGEGPSGGHAFVCVVMMSMVSFILIGDGRH